MYGFRDIFYLLMADDRVDEEGDASTDAYGIEIL